MITVATCLWAPNKLTMPTSGKYTEAWVERLYRGAKRNLSLPFRFVVFVDKLRQFGEREIHQELLSSETPGYGHFTEPYRLGAPMILCGLDTLFIKNIDSLARWCLEGDRPAWPRDFRAIHKKKDPNFPNWPINGVAFVPAGWRRIYDEWDGKLNDMKHIRQYPWAATNDLWPGQVVSYKMNLRAAGDDAALPKEVRVVYFHGQPKQDSLTRLQWIRENWK